MDNAYQPDLITLIDEDNVEHNFEILDTIENEKGVFYALYPIWLLTTNYKDKNYLFAMNGQTGKFVGDLPIDKGLQWRYILLTFAGTAAALTAIIYAAVVGF